MVSQPHGGTQLQVTESTMASASQSSSSPWTSLITRGLAVPLHVGTQGNTPFSIRKPKHASIERFQRLCKPPMRGWRQVEFQCDHHLVVAESHTARRP